MKIRQQQKSKAARENKAVTKKLKRRQKHKGKNTIKRQQKSKAAAKNKVATIFRFSYRNSRLNY